MEAIRKLTQKLNGSGVVKRHTKKPAGKLRKAKVDNLQELQKLLGVLSQVSTGVNQEPTGFTMGKVGPIFKKARKPYQTKNKRIDAAHKAYKELPKEERKLFKLYELEHNRFNPTAEHVKEFVKQKQKDDEKEETADRSWLDRLLTGEGEGVNSGYAETGIQKKIRGEKHINKAGYVDGLTMERNFKPRNPY